MPRPESLAGASTNTMKHYLVELLDGCSTKMGNLQRLTLLVKQSLAFIQLNGYSYCFFKTLKIGNTLTCDVEGCAVIN